ncbi:MAG TPA: DUF1566 domain-containing protein [Terracidiphilus sp.]|nr:DUF1566 domain-containing protein [Terracidiphilus sp.]
MKFTWQTRIVLVLLSAVTTIARAQFSSATPGLAQETQARGYWVDPSTGLMWAAKDNGEDVNWHQATEYCRNLRLAGSSDWRLATIDELRGIYEWNANTPGELPRSSEHEAFAYTFDVKGNIFLTGDPWSSSRISDDRGHPFRYAWYLNFNRGGRTFDELSFTTFKRALCVRGSTVVPSPPSTLPMTANAQPSTEEIGAARETEVRGYWVDPSTGLMWAWKDNGKRVSWHAAMRYCRNLRLAGYSDWKLATIDELEGLIDTRAFAPQRVGNIDYLYLNKPLHMKGNLLLRYQRQWSSSSINDDRGHPSSSYWYFDFLMVRKEEGLEDWAEGDTMDALCVRHSGE